MLHNDSLLLYVMHQTDVFVPNEEERYPPLISRKRHIRILWNPRDPNRTDATTRPSVPFWYAGVCTLSELEKQSCFGLFSKRKREIEGESFDEMR